MDGLNRLILVGFAGSGKNTVGEYLVYEHGYFGISFADALKDVVASIFCWDRTMLEGNTPDARKWRESVDPWWADKLGIPDFSPRFALRHIGTEVLRWQFNDRLWLMNVERRIEQAGDRPVVVFDGRFKHEIDLVTRTFGGTSLRVKRGPEPSYWNLAIKANDGDSEAKGLLGMYGIHPSEWDWIGHPIDITLDNDGTVDDLHRKVDVLLGRP